MGSLNCSCINSKDNSQINFENGLNRVKFQNELIQQGELLQKISDYYKSYKIRNLTQEEFFDILNLNENAKKILEESKNKFDDDKFDFIFSNKYIGPLEFIPTDNNTNNQDNNFIYNGEFNNEGIIDGKGIKIMSNKNTVYKGGFLIDKYHGNGILIKNKSSLYGCWNNGICSGNVEYIMDNEFKYNGNFENNKKNGFGIEIYQDGSQYEGNFVDNKKSGKGVYKFSNGEKYEGEFENDLYNGRGKYTWKTKGQKYEGEFRNGKINGKGIFNYEDGSIYSGNFVGGIKNGEGVIKFPNNMIFYGNWMNGELNGNGYLINGDEKTEVLFRYGKIISCQDFLESDNENFNLDKSKEEEEVNEINIKA